MKSMALKHCFIPLILLLVSCAQGPVDTTDQSAWVKSIQAKLASNTGRFKICGKYLTNRPPKGQSIEMTVTFRLNPTGKLETLWLDESGNWDSRFYDCLFNTIDAINFPAYDGETSIEMQQPLTFESNG